MVEDHVDRLRRQWARELPDLNTEPMAILGRAFRLGNMIRPSIEATFASFGLDRGEFDVIGTFEALGAALPADADGDVRAADDFLGRADPPARPTGEVPG